MPIVTSLTENSTSKTFQFFQNLNLKTFRIRGQFEQLSSSIGRQVMAGRS